MLQKPDKSSILGIIIIIQHTICLPHDIAASVYQEKYYYVFLLTLKITVHTCELNLQSLKLSKI